MEKLLYELFLGKEDKKFVILNTIMMSYLGVLLTIRLLSFAGVEITFQNFLNFPALVKFLLSLDFFLAILIFIALNSLLHFFDYLFSLTLNRPKEGVTADGKAIMITMFKFLGCIKLKNSEIYRDDKFEILLLINRELHSGRFYPLYTSYRWLISSLTVIITFMLYNYGEMRIIFYLAIFFAFWYFLVCMGLLWLYNHRDLINEMATNVN